MNRHTPSVFDELKIAKLPTLPHLLVEMLRICQDESANFQSIAAIIGKDPGVVGRIIALANSSFYSRGHKISSLERALLLLGIETLKTVIITASVQQFFSSFQSGHSSYMKSLWRHSLSCAMLARSLATLTGYEHPDEAYLTGLLHNIGELVLDSNYPDDFLSIYDASHPDPERQVEMENEMFLTNHCDIGAWLAEKWHLSDFAADAIRYHHSDLTDVLDAQHLVKIIYLSSALSLPDSLNQMKTLEAADQLFDLTASLTAEIVNQIKLEVDEIASSIGIEKAGKESTDSDNEKRILLAEQVRNLGLLQSSQNLLSQANSSLDLINSVRLSADMLFGFKNALVFWLNETSNTLEQLGQDDTVSTPALSITLQAERSLVASSALNRRILFSSDQQLFEKTLPVIDRQLIRITGSASIVCVPMIVQDQLKGVLVMGASIPTYNLSGSNELIRLFANQAGKQIQQLKQKDQENSSADQDLAAVFSQTANEIIHEANNPLSIIRNYLEALSSKLGGKHEAHTDIQIIREEIERTGNIILKLKDWENKESRPDNRIDLNAEIRSLVQLYESSLFNTRELNCRLFLDEKLNEQMTNRNALRQVITNLLKNATEALPPGGNINIRTAGAVNMNGKDFVEIVVSDDGPGIPSDIMRNIFKPVTSTKGKGHSGLGLSITRNLVNQMRGSISCRSTSRGTEFQILIPDHGEQ